MRSISFVHQYYHQDDILCVFLGEDTVNNRDLFSIIFFYYFFFFFGGGGVRGLTRHDSAFNVPWSSIYVLGW